MNAIFPCVIYNPINAWTVIPHLPYFSEIWTLGHELLNDKRLIFLRYV